MAAAGSADRRATRSRRRAIIADRIQREVLGGSCAALAAEAAQTQLLPWIAVGFGSGVALYFTAAREPLASVAVPVAAFACLVAFLVRRLRDWHSRRSSSPRRCAGLRQRGAAHHHCQTRSAGAAAVLGRADGLRRGPRGAREADRFVLRVARIDDLRSNRAAPPLGASGCRSRRGRHRPSIGFVELEGRSVSAADAAATRGLRFRAQSVF